MTAQEWLGELERLNEAATPGPWDVWSWSSHIHTINKRPVSPDDERTGIAETLKENDAAYIVAACGAVPRLVEMLKLEACLLECPYEDEKCPYDEDNTVSCAHCKVQRLYELTEPKE